MPPVNIESDPLFVLLTDALRPGPGSALWQQAVQAVRMRGIEGTDEHRLLLETRENLESGRDYRSVRAGPGFTRKVMAEIENDAAPGGKREGPPTATIVAILCGLLILSAVAYVVWRISPHEAGGPAQIDNLEAKSQGFVDTIASATFAGPIPDGWRAIGSLKLDTTGGLRPDPQAAGESNNLGGGVVLTRALAPGQSFAADVAISAPEPAAALLLEVFVTNDAAFSPEKGTSSRDLVWQLAGKSQQVLINGSGKIGDTPPSFHPGDAVRLIVGPDVAIVETVPAAGGKPQRLWAGPHEPGAGPRFVGIRFLQTGAAGKQDVSVQSIKIATAPG